MHEYTITQPPYNWNSQLGILNNYRTILTQIGEGLGQLTTSAYLDNDRDYADSLYDVFHSIAEAVVRIESITDLIKKEAPL